MSDLLAPHIPPDPSILELFSRSVSGLPSFGENLENKNVDSMQGIWHSVGDECPKFMATPWVDWHKNDKQGSGAG